MALVETMSHTLETHRAIDSQAMRGWDYGQNKFEFNCLHIRGSWQYRGEGNSNIVLALAEGNQVIRLSKVKVAETTSFTDWINEKKKLEREVIFANQIFGPLIGREFVGPVSIVKISPTQIAELNGSLKPIRPAYRLHKELGIPYATSHTDFARIHSDNLQYVDYCIEVKCKQGWWANSLLEKPMDLCTFCLNQFLKVKLGKVTGRSLYCPLNLFSGNPHRMIGAVLALLKTPQNNFRIFRNGVKVYGDQFCVMESLEPILDEWFSGYDNFSDCSSTTLSSRSKNLRNLVFLICKALLKPQQVEITPESYEFFQIFANLENQIQQILVDYTEDIWKNVSRNRYNTCNMESRELPAGSILFRILDVQKLGMCGSNCIYNLYPKICLYHASRANFSGNVPNDCPSKECLGEDTWLDETLSASNSLKELDVLCIENYLLAATAKDCSVMITFSPLNSVWAKGSPKDSFEDLYRKSHRVKIGVADLDPKPVTSIARHFVRDFDMKMAYQQILEKWGKRK